MTATPPPAGPDEGKYDLRKGAAAYAPIVGAFGALAVTAIVVVFTVASTPSVAPRLIALSTGLLVIGVFGSLIGAFGLAAIGAENDPTANLSAAVMFIAVPVVISILAILGAFEVLSVIYIDKSSELFVAVAGAGGLFGMVFNAFSIADSPGHHPTSFTATELNNWRNRQWLATRAEAYKAMKLIIVSTGLPTLVGIIVRLCGVGVTISVMASNWIIGVGILLCLAGTVLCLTRSMHPESGNEQVGLRAWEAWATNIVIGLYTLLIVFVLP